MEIYAYGEDALTLWALKCRLASILWALKDPSAAEECRVFYRPSFGRSGGPDSPQFGEFDFILLSRTRLYLGESKWDRSSEKILHGVLRLRDEQLLRHRLFERYVRAWAFAGTSNWEQLEDAVRDGLAAEGIRKPVAPSGSLLASNLRTVLSLIGEHFGSPPEIRNLLLYLHDATTSRKPPTETAGPFETVPVDYSGAKVMGGNYIRLDI